MSDIERVKLSQRIGATENFYRTAKAPFAKETLNTSASVK